MKNLFDFLLEKKNDFKGESKELDKLIKKIKTCWHAPVSEKDAMRMLPFAENTELVMFINKKLKDYFISCNEFKDDENGWKNFDVIPTWYLFTLLVYSKKVEDTVVFSMDSMIASKNSDLYILRRIFHLCNNPIYKKQFEETEKYFKELNANTTVYRWLNLLGVTPPPTYKWEFRLSFVAYSDKTINPFSDNVCINVRCWEPHGNGESFEINLTDRERNVQDRWHDFSNEDYFYFKSKKTQLKQVPNILKLKNFIAEIEEVYEIKFERKISSYFTKGFKKKENIQKWLLE